MAGLTITIQSQHTDFPAIIGVTAHLSRITKLTLHYQCINDMQRVLQLMTNTPTPMLKILSIDFAHLHQVSQDVPFRRIPSDVLIATPHLRHLKLRYINFDWSSPIFADLTTLFLEDIALTRRPSMVELVLILRKMPKLRSLTLRNALPVGELDSQQDKDGHQSSIVPLPHLEVVILTGNFSQIQAFTGAVALSSSISLIELDFFHDNHFELGTVISDLTKAYCTSTTHRHISLERYDPSASIDLIFSPCSETSRLQISIIQFNQPDRNDQAHALECDEKIFAHFFRSFNWTSLVTLNLNAIPPTSLPSARLMALTFGSLSSIKTVVVSLATASFFIEVLSLEFDNNSISGNSSNILIPFPGLRKIKMINVSFFKKVDDLSNDGNDSDDIQTHDNGHLTLRAGVDSQEEDDDEPEWNTYRNGRVHTVLGEESYERETHTQTAHVWM